MILTWSTEPVDGFETALAVPIRSALVRSALIGRGRVGGQGWADRVAAGGQGGADPARADDRHWLVEWNGRCSPLPVGRWHGQPEPAVRELVDRCIGGNPGTLLRRCAGLLRPGGTALVELDPPGSGLWYGRAHVAYGERDRPFHRGPAFRWARLGVEISKRFAADAGYTVHAISHRNGRWFTKLLRS